MEDSSKQLNSKACMDYFRFLNLIPFVSLLEECFSNPSLFYEILIIACKRAKTKLKKEKNSNLKISLQ